jgi:1-acyl-sn-glycerol-3-phosphate acyltransferase
MVPPVLVRRLVLAPVVIVVALGLIAGSPLLLVLALLCGLAGLLRKGRMRNLRLVSFMVVWLAAEIVALLLLLGLWLVSGFGGRLHTREYEERNYAIVRWFLDALYRGAERTYGLRIAVEPEPTGQEMAAAPQRPVIVLSRHAGPGDSFLLVRQLLSVYGRKPRVVMKASLQLDPIVDVMGNRLPNVWIKAHQESGEHIFADQIARMADGLEADGALVIFPEGGNWTASRWRRGIRRLERRGRRDLADRARHMPNLLPPRPGGTLAAIKARPDADVIFVAHAGLDSIASIGDVWHRFPVDQTIRARWWRVPRDQVPRSAGYEDQERWLYDWWEQIDSWISEHRPGGAAPVLAEAIEAEAIEAEAIEAEAIEAEASPDVRPDDEVSTTGD